MTTAEKHGQPTERGYEVRDFSLRVAVYFVFGLGVLVVIAVLLMWGLHDWLVARQAAADVPPPPLADTLSARPPAPRLQVNPPGDLRAFRQEEDQRMASYGWVQREAGVIHIPVERAKRRLLEQGLPVRPPPVKSAEE